MKIFYMIIIGFLLIPIISCAASNESFLAHVAHEQIEVPRKAAKRLMLLKDRIDKKHHAHLNTFIKVASLIEQGEINISKQMLHQGIKELQNLSHTLPAENIQEHEMLEIYVPKIQEEIADAPVIQAGPPTKQIVIGTSGTCCPREDFPCNSDTVFFCDSGQEAGTGGGNFSSKVAINDASDSVDCNSGALTVLGGVGIQGSLNVCGQEHIFNTTTSIDSAHGALVVDGGVGIRLNLNVGGAVKIDSKKQSDDLTTGALIVAGGQALGGNLNIGGAEHIINNTESVDPTTGALIVDGGVGIGGDTNTKGKVKIFDRTDSTSCIDGALVVAGGEGVGGNLNVCGKVHIFDQTNSTNCKNGALVVDGGVGIGRDTYICGGLSVQGPISTNAYFEINGGSVLATDIANCNLSVGDNTNPIANGTDNTAVGESAMQNNQVGTDNTAIGCQAMKSEIDGVANNAGGSSSMYNLVSGNGNTAWGYETSFSMVYNNNTTSVGYEALFNNQTDENTAVGAYALHENIVGEALTAVGFKALEQNNPPTFIPYAYLGSSNTAVGHLSQQYNTYGFDNTSIGASSSQYNYYGFSNTASGSSALRANESSYNTADGASSMLLNTIGAFNTAAGADSLSFSIVGYYNDSTGYSSMDNAIAPFYNVADGVVALSNVINPLRNVSIGYNTLGGHATPIIPVTYYPVLSHSDNVAVGFNAMPFNRVDANVAVGSEAMESNLYGVHNTAVGYQSMRDNLGVKGNLSIESSNNTAVGYKSMFNTEFGYENTCIGALSTTNDFVEAAIKNTMVGAFTYLNGGSYDVCIGDRANDYGNYDVIIGQDAQNAIDIFVFNGQNVPETYGTVVVGYQAYTGDAILAKNATALNIAIGYKAYSRDYYAIAMGGVAGVYGATSIGIGYNSTVFGYRSVAVGPFTNIHPDDTISKNPNDGEGNVAVGESSVTYGKYNTNVGAISQIKGSFNTMIGHYCIMQNTIAAPITTFGQVNGNTCVGAYSGGVKQGSKQTFGDYNTAVGYGATTVGTNVDYNVALGSYAETIDTIAASALGSYALSQGTGSIAEGYRATVLPGSLHSISIGSYSKVTAGTSCIAIGKDATTTGVGAIAIGSQATTTGINAIAIGNKATVLGVNGIALGNNIQAFPDTMVLGQPGLIGTYVYGISLISGGPLPVVHWNPANGALYATFCEYCPMTLPFSAEDDTFFELNRNINRSKGARLMDFDIIPYRLKNSESDELGFSLEGAKIAEICPELVGKLSWNNKYYLKLDQLVLLMLSKLQEHHKQLQDYEEGLITHDDEIQELKRKYQELTSLVEKLR